MIDSGYVTPCREFQAVDPADGAIVTVRRPLYDGLTKRELFAAMAMQGLLSSDTGVMAMPDSVSNGDLLIVDTAQVSVKLADALLAELAKPQEVRP